MGVIQFVSSILREEKLLPARRSSRRVDVSTRGTLKGDGWREKVWVADLSSGGAMIETTLVLTPFGRFVLAIPGWPDVKVEVRWVEGNRVGLAFIK